MTDQPKQYHWSEYEGTAYVSLISAKIAAVNDTLTLSDFTTISVVLGMRKDTGATITTTISSNVITVTSALSNVNVLLLVFGARA